MAIKTDFNFNGLMISGAVLKVERLWGSESEGWTSLVGVYMQDGEDLNLITRFNESVNYNESERGYVTMYDKLAKLYGGVKV